MTNALPDSFELDLFNWMDEALQGTFKDIPNSIGLTRALYCKRKGVIGKIYGIKDPLNMKMLTGTIIHRLIEAKSVRTKIVQEINKQLQIKSLPESKTELKDLMELDEGKVRIIPDIWTPNYVIEIKTTAIPISQWIKEEGTSIENLTQLNEYAGYYGHKFGILLMINKQFFNSGSANFKMFWDKYCYAIPFEYNEDMSISLKENANSILKSIKDEKWDHLEGAKHSWECKYCNKEIREMCGKEKYNCNCSSHRSVKTKYKALYEFSELLTERFTDDPMCELCFDATAHRISYHKYKYGVDEK